MNRRKFTKLITGGTASLAALLGLGAASAAPVKNDGISGLQFFAEFPRLVEMSDKNYAKSDGQVPLPINMTEVSKRSKKERAEIAQAFEDNLKLDKPRPYRLYFEYELNPHLPEEVIWHFA